jgi:hypothetical protein
MTIQKSGWAALTFLIFSIISLTGAQGQETSATTERSVNISEKGNVQRWRTSNGFTDFNIECRGKIELTDDDKDIKSISDDGYLEINKTVFGSKRTIVIESLGGGKIKKEYYEGRTKKDWDTSGKEWLAEVLPDLVRSSTIGAESRVERFFRQGGATAVLNEIGQLSGDYTKAHYAKLLLDRTIPASEMPRVITSLASEISSDYYLSTLLKDSMKKLMGTRESADAFFKATERISSDYYRSVVLKEALQEYSASPEQVKIILRSASSMSSDYYLSVVLSALLEKADVKEESLSELVTVSKNIASAYYRTEVLNRALQKPGTSKQTVKNVISAVADVDSDYYKTNVLNSLAEKTTVDPDLQIQMINVLDNAVGSDYYASVSLSKILSHQKVSDESFKLLVQTASKLSSATYAAEVLQNAAKKDLSANQLLAILAVAGNINSEYYLTTVLQSLAPMVKSADQATKDAYRQAARTIRSETYYGRALRAIE